MHQSPGIKYPGFPITYRKFLRLPIVLTGCTDEVCIKSKLLQRRDLHLTLLLVMIMIDFQQVCAFNSCFWWFKTDFSDLQQHSQRPLPPSWACLAAGDRR